MSHSNQVREFVLKDDGIHLVDVYLGPGEVLTGSARLSQEVRDKEKAKSDKIERLRRQRELQKEEIAAQAEAKRLSIRLNEIKRELHATQEQETEWETEAATAKSKIMEARYVKKGE